MTTARVGMRWPAQPGTRYSEQVAQSLVGQQVPLRERAHLAGPVIADLGTATVVAAQVVDGGRAVMLTLEVENS